MVLEPLPPAADLTVRLVDPRRARDLWDDFSAKQRRCYARYGAAAGARIPRPATHLIYCVAVRRGGTLVAGARLQLRTRSSALPVEGLVAHGALSIALRRREQDGVAEVGALWADAELAGSGIGARVIAAATAFAAVVGARHLVSFAHQHNRFTQRVGFEPDPAIGALPYPDDRYRSTVNWCDAARVPTALPAVRRAVHRMRRRAFVDAPIPLASFDTQVTS